jgi:carbon monoxide dehydrogenase subunit G
MAIEIRETFAVAAPIEAVWRFVMDPHNVASCMPGAKLEKVVDDRTFLGSIQVKLGAITTSYRGRVQLAHVDEAEHSVQMIAEGRETGGGTARATIASRLRSLPDGQTEVVADSTIDLTGRVMQVGRGMIQGVSHQLFRQFVDRTKQRLEVDPGGVEARAADSESAPIRIVPLVLKALWLSILRFFRRGVRLQ